MISRADEREWGGCWTMRTRISWTDQEVIDLDITTGRTGGWMVGCVETDEGCIRVEVVRGGTAVDVCADERIFDVEGVEDTTRMVLDTRTVHAGIALDARGVEGLVSLVGRATEICRVVAAQLT
jgi:hypothetical protein